MKFSTLFFAIALIAAAAPASALQYSGNPGDSTAPSAGTLGLSAPNPPGATTVTVRITGNFGDNGAVAPAAQVYDIRFSTNTITDTVITDPQSFLNASPFTGEQLPATPPGIDQVFTLGGLQANTTYFIAMKIGDEVPNWSTMSNVITFTTATGIPPGDEDGNSSTCLSTIKPTYVFVTLSAVALGALYFLRRR